METLLERLVLEPSWWDLGPSWAAPGRPRRRLGPSWRLGASWAVAGASWAVLGSLLLGDLGAVLEPSGSKFGIISARKRLQESLISLRCLCICVHAPNLKQWAGLEVVLGCLGAVLGRLGELSGPLGSLGAVLGASCSWGCHGPPWGRLGGLLGLSWSRLGRPCGVWGGASWPVLSWAVLSLERSNLGGGLFGSLLGRLGLSRGRLEEMSWPGSWGHDA